MGTPHTEDLGAVKPSEELSVCYKLTYLETTSGSLYWNLLSHLTERDVLALM